MPAIVREGYNYTVVQRDEEFADLIAELRAAARFSFDLETTGFSWRHDQIVDWVFSTRAGTAWCVPVGHLTGVQLPFEEVAQNVLPFVSDPAKIVIAHNVKFDSRFVRRLMARLNAGDLPTEQFRDTMHEAFVAAEGDQRFNLDDLVYRIFNVRLIKFDDLFPPRTKVKNIATVAIELAGEYACEDADFALRLDDHFYPSVQNSFIYSVEHKLWPVTQRIEDRGAQVDPELMDLFASLVLSEAEKVRQIIYDQVEQALGQRLEFNIASSKVLSEVLYDRMKLPVTVRTPKGAPATSELALEQLRTAYPICANILTYRSMLSTATSMGTTLKGQIEPETGRIHTSYNQCGATTGRYASSSPNLQNVGKEKRWKVILPNGDAYTVVITPRDVFVAADDFYLIELDFKQIEFIIMAALSGEESVVRAYERDEDVHALTASDVLRIPIASVTKKQRDDAKTWNYLIIYGGGGQGLSLRSDQTEEEANEAIRKFYAARPRFQVYINKVRDRARVTKKVATYFGRQQWVPEFFEQGNRARSKAERASVNRIIQGTAADIQKMGLLRTDVRLAKVYPTTQARCILQTHDSQTWEVHRSIHPAQIVPQLIDAMSPVVQGLPRIKVDAKFGVVWGSLHEIALDALESLDLEAAMTQWLEEQASKKASIRTQIEALAEQGLQPSLFPADEASEHGPNFDPLAAAMGRLDMGPKLDAIKEANRIVRDAQDVKRQIILLDPGRPLQGGDKEILIDILQAMPGNNILVIDRGDAGQVPIKKYPTSLTAGTVLGAFSQLFPQARAAVDRSVLAATITEELG